MSISKKLIGTTDAAGGLAIEDVFSTYLYTGSNSTQTITNGIDLAGEGGLVWTKNRDNNATEIDHQLMDSEQGAFRYILESNKTNAAFDFGASILTPQSDGFDLSSASRINQSGKPYASWTFRKAPRFFDVVTYTGDGVAGRTISHNLGIEPGMIVVKNRDTSPTNWAVWHRSLSVDTYLELNTTVAEQSGGGRRFGDDTNIVLPTDAGFTVGSNGLTNASGDTYVAYLFAHDPLGPSGDGSDGLIACGSYTGTGAAGNFIDLGWEPQWLLVKDASNANDWFIWDTMRGLPAYVFNSSASLNPNKSDAEFSEYGTAPQPTGFEITDNNVAINGDGSTYIYIAIRRGPMRQPESGTEVFAMDTRGGTAPNPPNFTSGFIVDAALRYFISGGDHNFSSRLTGIGYLNTASTAAEVTNDTNWKWDYMDGFYNGSSVSSTQLALMFRRAPGFFDVVAYTGDGVAGRTVPHNLGVAPEMMIVKRRDSTSEWPVYFGQFTPSFGNPEDKYFLLNDSRDEGNSSSFWDNTAPTTSNFTIGDNANVNASGGTYIAYLFANLPGVSKVGSYTGNGTNQTIDCGFTSGARFILIKRTDSTGDWYVWDTERGIVAGDDPFLELNTTDAEVTNDDSIDPDSSGFIVNQTATTNINVSSAEYIFLAIA